MPRRASAAQPIGNGSRNEPPLRRRRACGGTPNFDRQCDVDFLNYSRIGSDPIAIDLTPECHCRDGICADPDFWGPSIRPPRICMTLETDAEVLAGKGAAGPSITWTEACLATRRSPLQDQSDVPPERRAPVICKNPIRIECIDVFISGWQPRQS